MTVRRYSSEYKSFQPFVIEDIRRIIRSGVSIVGASGGAAVGEHLLSGALHTGALADSQAPQFLKTDGSRPLTGNLAVAAGVTIDGVDISEAVHPRLHGILSTADHTVTGNALQVVGLTATNTLGLLTPSSAPGGATAILRTDAGGLVTPYTLGVADGKIRSDNPFQLRNAADSAYQSIYYSAGFNSGGDYHTPNAHVFVNNVGVPNFVGAGQLKITNDWGDGINVPTNGIYSLGAIRSGTSVQTPLLTTFNGDLTITSASGTVLFPNAATLRSAAWTPGVLGSGWGLQERSGQAGRSHLDIRSIYVDELIATTFTADQVRVRSGSDWLGESLAIAARDNSDAKVTIPAVGSSVRIYVENAPEVTGRIFDENEHVLIKTINRSTGLVIRETWGQVSGYVSESGGRQSYDWATRSGGGGFTLEPGTALTGFGVTGGSYIFRTVVEAGRGPYERFATWSGNPYTPANRVSRLELGDIRNAVGDSTARYGIAAGNNLALTPATGFSGFSADSVYGFRLFNTELQLYNGSTRTMWLQKDIGLYFLNENFGGKSLRWSSNLNTSNPIDDAVIYSSNFGITTQLYISANSAERQFASLLLSANESTTGSKRASITLDAGGGTGSILFLADGSFSFNLKTSGSGYEFGKDGGLAPSFKIGIYEAWHAGNLNAPLDLNNFDGALRSNNNVAIRNTANSAYLDLAAKHITAAMDFWTVNGRIHSDNTISLWNLANTGYQNFIANSVLSYTGYITSDNTITFLNTAATAYQTVTASSFTTVGGGIYSGAAISLLTTAGQAQQVRSGSVLASNDYNHNTRVPTNGIYSLGGVAIATPEAITAGYTLDVNGNTYARGNVVIGGLQYLAAQGSGSPPTIANFGVAQFVVLHSTNNRRYVIAYNDSGTVKYRWMDLNLTGTPVWNYSTNWNDVID